MDSIVHFEIPYDDKERAEKFYSKIFGWKLNPMPEMKYTIVHTASTDENGMIKNLGGMGAINGGMFKKPERNDLVNPVLIINVNDIDEAVQKIKEGGGKIIREKVNVGDMGIVAYFKDSEGNVLGLWQTLNKM